MGVEDKDFMMRQIKQLAEGLGNFLGKEDINDILGFEQQQVDDTEKSTSDPKAE